MPGVPADRVAVAGMSVAVHAFQHSRDRQDGESPLDGEQDLEVSRAGSALPAGTALGAPFGPTGRGVIGSADRIDTGERSCRFPLQGVADVGKDRLEAGTPVFVF